MPEKPIPFSGSSVKATLAGKKAQTRPICKIPLSSELITPTLVRSGCPYGSVGDKLWVQETWGIGGARLCGPCLNYKAGGQSPVNPGRESSAGLWFASHNPARAITTEELMQPSLSASGWRSSTHMPRWASRITLEITGVRVERLNDISEADAKAEGISEVTGKKGIWDGGGPAMGNTPQVAFMRLWDSINGKKHPWASNPWVWAISFKVVANA